MVNLDFTASETAPNPAIVTVKKGGEVIATGDDLEGAIAIDEGDNTITVDVLAPDFVSTKTYTLTINRASANASDDDRLSSLRLSSGMLMPAFDPNSLACLAQLPTSRLATSTNPHAYADRVANSVESVIVRAQAAHSGAMINITSSSQDSSVIGWSNRPACQRQ